MNNNMVNGIFFSIISLFYCILINIIYFTKEKQKSIENSIYSKLLICNLIGLIIEIFPSTYVIRNMLESNYSFSINILKLILVYFIIWISLFTYYVVVICTKDRIKSKIKLEKNNSKYKYALIFCSLLGILIIYYLKLDAKNINGAAFSYGPAANFVYAYSGINIAIWIIELIRNLEHINRKKYYPIFAFIILGVFVMLIQYMWPQLTLMISMQTFVTFLMYFTIENPDMKLINELNLAKNQAERANKAKTEFLSSMSHEIRTPLNAIVGFSNSLNDNKNIPEDAKSDVKDILVASDSLLEIVNGVLDISKIEANKIEIIKKEYDTKKMFDELAKLTKVRIGDKPIEFVTSFDETLPRVLYGDQTRTKQVILNVLTNAAKYTDKGKITFSVQSVIKDNVCRMIISVEDTGRGIKKESIDKLFDKFERLDEDRNTTIEGTGLGLAITKKLLEMMYGKIVVQSVYGKGSKFTISLDQRIVKNPTIKLDDEKIDDIEIIDLSSKKVLVVDDNKLNIKVASRLLSPYKVEIVPAESGFEAIEILKKDKKIDLVLMDDMMPKMSGTETLKEIKKNNLYDGPIIALTANALTGMREKYIEHGFTDYLSKPIEKSELNRILKTYLTK